MEIFLIVAVTILTVLAGAFILANIGILFVLLVSWLFDKYQQWLM